MINAGYQGGPAPMEEMKCDGKHSRRRAALYRRAGAIVDRLARIVALCACTNKRQQTCLWQLTRRNCRSSPLYVLSSRPFTLTITLLELPGAEPNLASASYCIRNESHTLGNAVRWMLMKKFALNLLACRPLIVPQP